MSFVTHTRPGNVSRTVQDKEHCFTKVVIAVNSMVLDSAEYSRSRCLYPDQTVIFTLFIELFFFKNDVEQKCS